MTKIKNVGVDMHFCSVLKVANVALRTLLDVKQGLDLLEL